MLHEVHLVSGEHAGGCAGCQAFLTELQSLARKKARVYALPANVGDYRYKLMTTSKDLFLGLGRMSQWARDHLCVLICDAIGEAAGPVVYTLPSFTDEGESRTDKELLVSCSSDPDSDGAYALHLSMAS